MEYYNNEVMPLVDKYGFFVPWKNKYKINESIIKLNHYYKQKQYCFKQSREPFFCVVNENCTPKSFIDAVMKDSYEDAESYISKNFASRVDIEDVKKLFKEDCTYKYLINIPFEKNDLNVKSIMLKDKNSKFIGILHFYLINEPDIFGNWKIYKVVKEL